VSRKLRVVVADDEPLARRFACRHLATMPEVGTIDECEDGDALADRVGRQPADVLLVDVRMPGADVFATLERLLGAGATMPAVVFATAFDAYAVRAFEVNAVDYLLKPFSAERLVQAFTRVRQRRNARDADQRLAAIARDMGSRPARLLVPDRGRMVPIAVDDITWIQAEDDYSRVHVGGRSYLVSRSLRELEQRLDPAVFLRIHRSAIVRVDAIAEVEPQGSSRHRVLLKDKTTLVVSRTHAARLKALML
jgi:DNA-binding LytR/AlgR family response regulator